MDSLLSGCLGTVVTGHIIYASANVLGTVLYLLRTYLVVSSTQGLHHIILHKHSTNIGTQCLSNELIVNLVVGMNHKNVLQCIGKHMETSGNADAVPCSLPAT